MEIWKKVRDFENYEVSNLGRVKRLCGGFRDPIKEDRIVNGIIDKDGYNIVYLCNGRKKMKLKKVHKLVYESFNDCEIIWPITINHINKIKDDNRLENLEALSTQDNTRYSLKGKKRINMRWQL